jgi:ERCC4-type nuclease
MKDFNNFYANADLEKARSVRKRRSEIKKELKEGTLSLNDLLNHKDIYAVFIRNMKVIEIVSSLPGIGKVNAEKILKKLNISLIKKINGLGKIQAENFLKYFKVNNYLKV